MWATGSEVQLGTVSRQLQRRLSSETQRKVSHIANACHVFANKITEFFYLQSMPFFSEIEELSSFISDKAVG